MISSTTEQIFSTSSFLNYSLIQNSTSLTSNTYHQPVRIMWYRFLLIIIIFVTAAGNLLVCLAITRERKLQNTTNYFLMSLAIADCLVAILVMPMGMISEAFGRFPLPNSACIIFATLDVLCCTSSIWHMSTMSMDRYFTIRFPFRYGRNKTRRIMLLKIIAVWAISAAVSSPILVLGIIDIKHVLSENVCAPNNASFKIYGSIFAFYIPCIIMITTYALTMRSLRNVLVHKKKYNRQRIHNRTFRPFIQIINQYTDIAQGIGRASITKSQFNQRTMPHNKTDDTNVDKTSSLHETQSSKVKSSLVTDSNIEIISTNSSKSKSQQTSSIDTNIETIDCNSSHSTTSRSKSIRVKIKFDDHKQTSTNNTTKDKTKNSATNMSTLYETTEYSKSTSSSYETAASLPNIIIRQPIIKDENSSLRRRNKFERFDQDGQDSIIYIDNETDLQESINMEASSVTYNQSSTIDTMEPIVPTILPTSFYTVIEFILKYYLFIFPYRLHPLSIEYSSNKNQMSSKLNQSTSISSIDFESMKIHRTVATQTNELRLFDLKTVQSNNTDENLRSRSPLTRKFPFNRSILSSPFTLTNLFRPTPTPPAARSSGSSTKTSVSSGARSSATSSINQIRQPYSSAVHHRMESENEPILANDFRSRTSTSSSSLLYTTNYCGKHSSINDTKSFVNPHYKTYSTYVSSSLCKPLRYRQYMGSGTTTNSSDSSSTIQRYHSRLLSNVPQLHQQQQRMRDEDIVAANERKALRVLMIIFCVFITLWTPFFICTLISAVCETCRERISNNVWFSITWLGYSSSMANPFIYTIFSDLFRRSFKSIICCQRSNSLSSGQYSTKLSYQRGGTNPRISCRRSPNHDISGTSTPMLIHRPTPIHGTEAAAYLNRYTVESLR